MCIDGKLDRLALACESWPRETAWLVKYIKSGAFATMMDESLRGDRHRLDKFVGGLHAVPRGTVVHWLSGNVPVLSILSALMSIMTGNRTVLKISSDDTGLTKACLDTVNDDVVYVSNAVAKVVSAAADVRVAWGGREAVDAIVNLPRKWDSQDVIFGPKLSLALVDRDHKTCDVARAIAKDVVALDQMGCNSPQTVVVEGDAVEFAGMIVTELDRMGGAPFNASRWTHILRDRCGHYSYGNVLGPISPRYTVLYSDSPNVPTDPAMGRTVYVREVDNMTEVKIPEGTQTLGVTPNVPTFTDVDRIVPVGQMTDFSVPWDGIYPMERMIRWISLT